MSRVLIKAKIPYRIGCTQGSFDSSSFFLTRKALPVISGIHKVQENLRIGKTIGVYAENPKMEIYPSAKDVSNISKILKKNNLKDYAILHPGKRSVVGKGYLWDDKKFAEIADYLIEKYKMKIIIGGSEEDKALAEEIISNSKHKDNIIDLTGNTNIKEYAVLISKAKILASVDTSAIHLASCFGTKTVALFCTYPEIWHPYQDKKNYVLLFAKDVKNIPLENVKTALDMLLK